ncbi:heptaprenyl diphosphate synthase component 1 [Bacillus taeanensis]|uniref:Heptaprenyl diphosphate synthase n=1 Tax=Bacillus taeanensis TaxID=273032 RepID=A0A366XYR3_9BACI|nr:heptaprenyl diphosphate synthase component 1 [Bacillus taeanensis]RBW70285.1 heptaprenyl diphosphate synthase [Bacillus taeanensis]
MKVYELERVIASLKEELAGVVNHPYILKFIERPEIDEDKLMLLYFMLNEQKIEQKDQYILPIMLVQIALDTHDTVSQVNLINEQAYKNQQLTVLAGDYYSSLYYYFLSQINDIKMIRVLAGAIQEINEKKMNYHHDQNQSIDEIIEQVSIIESGLLQKVAKHFNLSLWQNVCKEYLLARKLVLERNRLLQKEASIFLGKVENVHHTLEKLKPSLTNNLVNELDGRIQKCLVKLDNLLIDQLSSVREMLKKKASVQSN